ncbi:MAG: 3-hydroxyacyl-CoA dehydrogenase family protein [Candidatus Aenigmatarchaeota archaeon]
MSAIHLPPAAEVKSIAQSGFGTMGWSWATAELLAGLDVYVHEPNIGTVAKNRILVEKNIQVVEDKGKIPSGFTDKAMERLHFVTPDELVTCGAPMHIEITPESLANKIALLQLLGPRFPEGTVQWTNTSCLNVEKLAIATGFPEGTVGTHGMNPVHRMPGVEVVQTELVDAAVLQWTIDVLEKVMGKITFVAQNVPGFIVNKLGVPFWLEVIRMLVRREADIATIDKALLTSLGHPQAGFKLMDFIGTGTMIDVADELYAATQDPRYIVPQIYREMRKAGFLGFQSGRGFYDWTTNPKNPHPIPFNQLLAA